MSDLTQVFSCDFISSLYSNTAVPVGFERSYELRCLNADLYVYRCKDAEVAVVRDGNGVLEVSSVVLL